MMDENHKNIVKNLSIQTCCETAVKWILYD